MATDSAEPARERRSERSARKKCTTCVSLRLSGDRKQMLSSSTRQEHGPHRAPKPRQTKDKSLKSAATRAPARAAAFVVLPRRSTARHTLDGFSLTPSRPAPVRSVAGAVWNVGIPQTAAALILVPPLPRHATVITVSYGHRRRLLLRSGGPQAARRSARAQASRLL